MDLANEHRDDMNVVKAEGLTEWQLKVAMFTIKVLAL